MPYFVPSPNESLSISGESSNQMRRAHPVLLISILVICVIAVALLPNLQKLPWLAGLVFFALCSYERDSLDLLLRLTRFLLLAIALLFAVNAIDYSSTSLASNWNVFISYAIRLICFFTAFYIAASTIDKDRLFSALVHLRVPIILVFLVFRTFWIVRLLEVRSHEIVTAQRLRGFPTNTTLSRITALMRGSRGLVNGLLVEMFDANGALASKGLLGVKRPVSARNLVPTISDYLLVISVFVIAVACVTIAK